MMRGVRIALRIFRALCVVLVVGLGSGVIVFRALGWVSDEHLDRVMKALRNETSVRTVEIERPVGDEWRRLADARQVLQKEVERRRSDVSVREQAILVEEAGLVLRKNEFEKLKAEVEKERQRLAEERKKFGSRNEDQAVRSNIRRFVEMPPDDVADLLDKMKDEEVAAYLRRMPDDYAAQVLISLKKRSGEARVLRILQ